MRNEHVVTKNSIAVKSLALQVFNCLAKLKYHKTVTEFTFFYFFPSQRKSVRKAASKPTDDCTAMYNAVCIL